jgi:hypothetical protein
MSCHFIDYPEKSKVFHFYCPDRHTKFIETIHIVFLEDGMMRGSTVPREIRLKEKQVYMHTHIIHELIPPVHVHERTIPTFEVVSSSATHNINEAQDIQEPEVPNIVIDEKDQPQNLENDVPNQDNHRRT